MGKLILRFLCIIISMSYQCQSYSGEINLYEDLYNVHYMAQSYGNDTMTPLVWDIIGNTPPADAIIIGGVTNPGIHSVKMTNAFNGDEMTLDVNVLGGHWTLAPHETTQAGNGGIDVQYLGGIAYAYSVKGYGIGKLRMNLKETGSPVMAVRPLISALSKLEFPSSGLYHGFTTVTFMADFIRDGVKFRHYIPIVLRFNFYHMQSWINSVEVIGDGVMDVINISPTTISGKTTYIVRPQGINLHGVKMELIPNSDLYTLKSNDINNEEEIPYSVSCISGCALDRQNELIKDGKAIAMSDEQLPYIYGDSARLQVSFDNISTVKPDKYSGSFTVMFKNTL
ncbi:hypothetical protein PUN50_10045 [Vibrio campbellii]|uniref:Fimbrial protein n=1 Tax=Vibrio campbellii TaxID=680 RepID=A0AAQ2XWB4_9VIBR|nr:hypothetical protein [Vibrio campbellii]WDG07090.1 hypothetical protein PUN50_10045 [Vibrio campbellii]